jgi:hypothetical protein
MVNLLDMDSITGGMAAALKEISSMAFEMEKEFGWEGLANPIDTKEPIATIKNGEKVFLHGQAEIYIKVSMKMIWETALDRCFGQMAVFTKEIGWMEFNMEKVILFLHRINICSELGI